MATKTARPAPARLALRSPEQTVVIERSDRSRIGMLAKQLEDYCDMHASMIDVQHQLEDLDRDLHEWLVSRPRVQAADLVARTSGRLLFLVQQPAAETDDAIGDAMIDLDMRLANDPRFSHLKIDVLAISPAAPDSLYGLCADGFGVFQHEGDAAGGDAIRA